ncbi:MAG: TlpA family protein disulfide reductase [Candidatus Rokubacteria bacterium]|nr:TlpA family protein disulfide reductase [Candidatus Rokubacteria bacterium]
MQAFPTDRQALVRLGLGVVLVGVLVWTLPQQRPGDSGAHPAPRPVTLDPFERAGVTELQQGQRGPGFRLAFMDGRVATLDDWRDHLVVLNFWATWCQPCTVEMPALEALWKRYRDRGLVVVGVSVDRGAPRGVLDPYLRKLDLTFPILLDPELETARAWRVTALPATFIIRPGGEVAGIAVGAREWAGAEMTSLLETMLPGPRHAVR